jgi:hypothetical protein
MQTYSQTEKEGSRFLLGKIKKKGEKTHIENQQQWCEKSDKKVQKPY